jgi:hypothetical protein
VKVDVDTLSTVPDAPPAAGPDRALPPPPPNPGRPEGAPDVLLPGAAPDLLLLLLELECSTA